MDGGSSRLCVFLNGISLFTFEERIMSAVLKNKHAAALAGNVVFLQGDKDCPFPVIPTDCRVTDFTY